MNDEGKDREGNRKEERLVKRVRNGKGKKKCQTVSFSWSVIPFFL